MLCNVRRVIVGWDVVCIGPHRSSFFFEAGGYFEAEIVVTDVLCHFKGAGYSLTWRDGVIDLSHDDGLIISIASSPFDSWGPMSVKGNDTCNHYMVNITS